MVWQDATVPRPVMVDEAIGESGLVFRPALRRGGYHPEVLAQLAEHGLVDMTRLGESAYRVYVTPVGRDCYDDMCGLT